jgi:hypothetical protein
LAPGRASSLQSPIANRHSPSVAIRLAWRRVRKSGRAHDRQGAGLIREIFVPSMLRLAINPFWSNMKA